MAAGIVGDDGMRHPVFAKFPGGELGALAARPRFVHPNVNRNPGIMRGIDGRSGGPIIDEREPAGVAMG